jgi:ABC-type sugar transport system ATPase subunit
MNLLKVSGISRKQGNDFELKDISFTQDAFQNIAIAGETGSGKSTLLKIISGLMNADSGEVIFENERVKKVPEEKLIPGHKGISYLSQHFELPNFLTVEQILSYATLVEEEDAQKLYEVFRIGHLLKRRTDQLSGGEKQRIAMARLLVTSPRLLVMDEPFSNMDMNHKTLLKSVIRDIRDKLNTSCILTSHDPLDTLPWADQIFVMRHGHVLQQGTPMQVYRQPVNEYTAGLFGKYNLIKPINARKFYAIPGTTNNGKDLLIRPEDLHIVSSVSHAIPGQVKKVFYFGSHYEAEIQTDGNLLTIRMPQCLIAKGESVYLSVSPEDICYL